LLLYSAGLFIFIKQGGIMTQVQKEKTKSYFDLHNLGNKLTAFIKQPLLTIQFTKPIPVKHSAEKRTQPVETKKTVSSSKPVKRSYPVSTHSSSRPVMHRNTSTSRKNTLYTFTPSRNKEEFEKILFVLRACDNSGDSTMFTNVLHVENIRNGARLVATDRKRMHVTDVSARIKPGNYKASVTKDRITLEKSGFCGDYPDWKSVVPKDAARCGCINLDNAASGKTNIANSAFTKMSGEKINPDYLADLTKNVWAVYRQSEKRKAVLLKEYGSRETYAVIMPMAA
jgi:hypothetical protein